MTTNRWIESSRRIFSRLLTLYPREYRSDFSDAMLQVFTDQCRDAYQQNGGLGIVLLWLRVLPDLGYTAVVEHLSTPRASWGLMEPVPDEPLPWKGVLLILFPGLVYLISQIAQLNGETWYLTVYYRAAFFLIIPVLIVWAVTRRFPIWGLIPAGLLFRLVQEIGYQLIILHPDVFSSNTVLNFILEVARKVESDLFLPAAAFFLLTVAIAIFYFRRHRPTRGVLIWGGGFVLVLLITAGIAWANISAIIWNMILPAERQFVLMDLLKNALSYTVYNAAALLLLVFLGTFFVRRHGFFSILILVGYILPVMVVGTPWDLQNNPDQLLIITLAVMTYRSMLSLIAPVWMSRVRTQTGKKKVIILSIAVALGIHAVMQFYPAIFTINYTINSEWILDVALNEALLVTAILLGMALYQVEPDHEKKDTITGYSSLPELVK